MAFEHVAYMLSTSTEVSAGVAGVPYKEQPRQDPNLTPNTWPRGDNHRKRLSSFTTNAFSESFKSGKNIYIQIYIQLHDPL